jgi:hypothetical protein
MQYYRPGEIPLTELELKKDIHDKRHLTEANRGTGTEEQEPSRQRIVESGTEDKRNVRAANQRSGYHIDLSDLINEPDSFKRQKEALFRLARHLKRLPTLNEGLNFIRENNLFSGPWDDNLERRKARVKSILKFISRTFDAGKCANGSVNIGKYDIWAAKHFPHGFSGRTRRYLTEEGEIIQVRERNPVSPQFIATFLAVCEFALIMNKNPDETLPHNRAKEMWEALYAKGVISVPFCARKWAVCREELVTHGIIQITNRHYHPGKAMEWNLGPYFPFLGLWKKRRKASGNSGEVLWKRVRRTRGRHNTLLHRRSLKGNLKSRVRRSRAPP